MKKAQIFCVCLTLALLLALVAPAHAADALPFETEPATEGTPEPIYTPEPEDVPGPDMEISGEVAVPPDMSDFLAEKPVISVRVPDSGRVVVNPYHLEVALGGEVSREQIVSETYALYSECDLPVAVSVHAVGTVPAGSEAVFVTEPPQTQTERKEVFMYAEFQERYGAWQGSFTDAYNQVMATGWGESKRDVLTLEPWGEGRFRLFGAASVPVEGMWSERDIVNVTLAFTFEAAETEAA